MKTPYLFGAAIAAGSLGGLVHRVEAATAAAFTFETSGVVLSSTTATGSTYSLTADIGTGTMVVSHGSAGSAATYTSPVGNGSARGFSSKNWQAPDSYVFSVPTTGLTNIMISFDITADANGPKDFGVAFNSGSFFTSVAGSDATFGSSTGFGAASNPSFHFTYDFSTFTSLNNNSAAQFRLQDLDFNFNRTDGGTSYIDNFVVSGTSVPEPATMALAVVAVGGLLGRRSRQ